MRTSIPFRTVLTLSFSAILLLLYALASLTVLAFQHRQSRTDLHYLLYSQAESLAGYLASTGRLDFPELRTFDENTPVPVWLRVVRSGTVLASTPTLPAVGTDLTGTPEGRFEVLHLEQGGSLLSVRHQVWNQPETWVEAFADRRVLAERSRKLLANLLLAGLMLIPAGMVAGHGLARYALQPVSSLTESIRSIDSSNLSQRLEASGPVHEIRDLAEEFNRLLERVEHTVGRMERFTASASHELRTPIASLRTGIEVTLRRQRSPREYRDLLRDLLHEIDRVQRVVEGLMALARTPSGDLPVLHSPVDLVAVVRSAVRSLRPLAAAKNLEVLTAIHEPVEVPGNEAQLQLMLFNLLDNAVRHSPRSAEVRVEVGSRDARARVVVSDQGPGVPVADRPYIFERHFQGRRPDGTRRSSRAGGIGLDLVRWVVTRHHGNVRLLDDEPGARFEVLLPLVGESGGGS